MAMAMKEIRVPVIQRVARTMGWRGLRPFFWKRFGNGVQHLIGGC
jgi:hypothetical protein